MIIPQNFLIAFFTPFLVSAIDFKCGFIFAGCNLAGAAIVFFLLYESSGLSLEHVDLVRSSAELFRLRLCTYCGKDLERTWNGTVPSTLRHARGRAIVTFVAALFKEGLVTESALHKYTLRLLGDPSGRALENIRVESVCDLLSTTGPLLINSPRGRSHMAAYSVHMKEWVNTPELSLCVRSRLQVCSSSVPMDMHH